MISFNCGNKLHGAVRTVQGRVRYLIETRIQLNGSRVGNEPSEPSDEQDFTSRASGDLPELAARRTLTLARSFCS